MKNVNWDKCPIQGLTDNSKDCLPLDFDLKVVDGMRVSSEYQGNQVHLTILDETYNNKFTPMIPAFKHQKDQ